jgi:hypothetical protein
LPFALQELQMIFNRPFSFVDLAKNALCLAKSGERALVHSGIL